MPYGERLTEILHRSFPLLGVDDLLAPTLKTNIELATNHNYYFDSDLVPEYMLRNNKGNEHLTFYQSTPEPYVWAASKLRSGVGITTSPLKIQHFVRGFTSAFYDDTIRYIDKVYKGTDTKADFPMFRGLINKDPRGFYSRGVRGLERYATEAEQLQQLLKKDAYLGKEEKAENRRRLSELAEHVAVFNQIEDLRKEAQNLQRSSEKTEDTVRREAQIARQM